MTFMTLSGDKPLGMKQLSMQLISGLGMGYKPLDLTRGATEHQETNQHARNNTPPNMPKTAWCTAELR
ncbi:hypothetical protein P7K49_003491 [Saguinus oedipus]|uniref:Uncharacterized protein n=1 Tax=Saguinus oedipus TaxID=9490 RepID=A0ABQ9W582_SAGOE|nr:hypothetical protein P7K49_003491 [Saguinus oedipus]